MTFVIGTDQARHHTIAAPTLLCAMFNICLHTAQLLTLDRGCSISRTSLHQHGSSPGTSLPRRSLSHLCPVTGQGQVSSDYLHD